jgi:ATP-dependent DNA helicase RecG
MSSPMTETELQNILQELLTEVEMEHEFVEFKLSDKRYFGEYLSALSNGACLKNKDFGFLVFGVEDKTGKILGTTVSEGDLNKIGIKKMLEPRIYYSTHQFFYQNKKIILVKIDAAKGQPTYFSGKAYARIGEHKTSFKNLSENQIRKIYNSTIDWSAHIVNDATFEDLDEIAVIKACEKIREQKPNLRSIKDPKTLLNKARITLDNKITRASLILLGKPESTRFLSPSTAEIIHRLVDWSLAPNEVTGKHFGPPFFLTVNDVWKNIRNNKIKIFASTNLLPDIVDKYDEEPILEALNNCIAHQDYNEKSRIILQEKPDMLTFESAGGFFEGKVEDYVIEGTKTPKKYRNWFLASAMRELGMIDIYGSGINKIYRYQFRKFFPAPDYKSDNEMVSVTIYGKIINENFSRILMKNRDLDLTSVILLDHVQKGIKLTDDAAKLLRKKGFIEGKKPNYFISAEIAEMVEEKAKYIKNKALDKDYYKSLILKFIDQYKSATRKELDDLLMEKLSEILSNQKKKKKIDNLIQEMSKKDKTIKNVANKWVRTCPKKLGEN